MHDFFALAISAILGGGFFKGIEALYRAFTDSKEKKALTEALGVKTPVEVESVSIDTMTKTLDSATRRIKSLEEEGNRDRKLAEERLVEAEKRRLEEKAYYQSQILELKQQVELFRAEIEAMEEKLSELLAASPRPEEGENV